MRAGKCDITAVGLIRARFYTRILISSFALTLLTLGPGCLTSQSDRPIKALFHPLTGRAGQIDQAQRPRIIRHRFVGVELNLLSATVPFEEKAASGQLFLLNLFDDTTFRVILDRREVRSDKSFTWFGRIEGIENSQVTLVVEDGVLVGNVNVHDAVYQVRYAGEGIHVVYQIDPRTFPPESEPVVVPGGR